ncbi:unnamed protein product, partial [Rotaria sp. Silwood2]
KLNNIDVLYSLLDVDNQRLDMIVEDKTFTNNLNFVLTMSTDDIFPIGDSILNRFCISILPRIGLNIKSLILESGSMERILLATDYPNLYELKLFNFNNKIASHYFTIKSPVHHIFQKQITNLILVCKTDNNILSIEQYTENVHKYIFNFCENLKHLSFTGSCVRLSFRNLPLTICSSSTLYKLSISVNRFEDCLALLDGRLNQLNSFFVEIFNDNYQSSIVNNMNDLPNLKCFSLKYVCVTEQYDSKILPLLRRMSNLEELTLYITIQNRIKFIDGIQINNQILIHMPRLYKFIFYISSDIQLHHLVPYLSSDDIQQTFTNIGYQQVACILSCYCNRVRCHVFSLPFVFDSLRYIGNVFPSIVFSHVTNLGVYDVVPFKHEFFLRIAQFFPLIKELYVINSKSQSQISDNINSNDNQLHSIVEYPYLISLCLGRSHIDYYEQFLNDTKTHLPRLTTLTVNYDKLTIVTKNFTRNAIRLNCANVKELIIERTLVHSKDFYVYFPLVTSFSFD